MKPRTIDIGKGEHGQARLNVARLLVSRMLITASSGGGKSWLLRLLLERVSKTTQTIAIDTEGEFSTLREKRDLVLAGPGGEAPVDPRSAGLLCRRLMELNLSAVIDVSELALKERREFVTSFCNTMVDLPRSLWRACVVAVDEIHEFAPEKESADSGKALARLSSKGRKRGYCLVGATQRLQKLDKDVAAEMRNVCIGQMTLDVDLQRAASSLGFAKDRWADIRDLSPPGQEGQFWAFGPAFNHRGVFKFRAAQVETTHPEPGQGRLAEPPAPSAKIRSVLDELQQIPEQAEAEIRDLATAKTRIADLERALRVASPRSSSPASTAPLQAKQDARTIARLRQGIEVAMKVIGDFSNATAFEAVGLDPADVRRLVEATATQIVKLAEAKLNQRNAQMTRLKAEAGRAVQKLQSLLVDEAPTAKPVIASSAAVEVADSETPASEPSLPPSDGLTKPQQKILDTILILDLRGVVEPNKEMIARWIGVHPRGGSFGENIGFLRAQGYLDDFKLTDFGRSVARISPTGFTALLAAVQDEPKRKILRSLDQLGAQSREQLARSLGVHPRGGSFGENLGCLRTMGLITSKGDIALTDVARR